jgi:hypothetical protein
MNVTIHLANSANVDSGGLVNALGLGWQITGPSPLPPFSVIVLVTAPEDRSEEPFEVRLQLTKSTGEPVMTGDPDEAQPVELRVMAHVGPSTKRPAGLPTGANLLVEMAPGLLLEPGIYEWVVSIDGESQPSWRRPFYVRAKPDEFPPTLARPGVLAPAPGQVVDLEDRDVTEGHSESA